MPKPELLEAIADHRILWTSTTATFYDIDDVYMAKVCGHSLHAGLSLVPRSAHPPALLRRSVAGAHIKEKGYLIVMSMGYLIKIDGSPFWQARFPGKSGVEVQRSTKTRDRKQAEAILAGWALQANLERQPGLCQARVRRVAAEMSRLVGGDTTPEATYQAARDTFLARSKAMGLETGINRRSALKSFDV